MSRRDSIAPLALLGALVAAPAAAQVCGALPSLGERSFRVTASAASYTYATALGVSITAGRTVYGTLGFGRTRDPELDASTYPLSLEFGADIADNTRRFFLCPVASAAVSFGPYDFQLLQDDFRYTEGTLGLGLGAVAARSRRLTVLLAAGIRAAWLTGKYWPTGTKAQSSSGASERGRYWLLSVGVGLELGRLLTIRPGLTIPFAFSHPDGAWFAAPFGRKEDETSFGVAVSLGLGRRGQLRPPAPPAPPP